MLKKKRTNKQGKRKTANKKGNTRSTYKCRGTQKTQKNATLETMIQKQKISKMHFKIESTWDGFPVRHEPVCVRLSPGDKGVKMEVSAPFFNDPPAPLGEPGKPFSELWNYEVVEAFFLNDKTEQYLEVELCPHGQHLVLLLSGRRNVWKKELALSFKVARGETNWEGTAYLPWSYFPPNVTQFNSFAIHGSNDRREYESLYPVPQHELQQGQKPDFHRLEYFKPFSFNTILGEEWKQPDSDLWLLARPDI
ncbi:UPF0462 protein C4orf33 homolog isoform X1 [Meriones unguiculatus]|uniref:UPF0462 protein C4orf33 homolog isoform X1 n=2 Tax=Meriones unguiculatus TaxID=10047 RepID=UPI00293E8A21|nr:UPF0462 protein C4orf33 homolog isoform X1 [Meriones unguiculatus]XP_060234258.1 UPF0462 protein C4orf33 homolog isoform X1 [Meriones unguiculatus]XP_060234259.1 UPF0462 protein C4orf33 homolog isoform X1 [Meriones unguiculatus]XP_060234260.1 UPF0462 protein C4orf33 homolog isoform X1 [Meriones unguiculatus]